MSYEAYCCYLRRVKISVFFAMYEPIEVIESIALAVRGALKVINNGFRGNI